MLMQAIYSHLYTVLLPSMSLPHSIEGQNRVFISFQNYSTLQNSINKTIHFHIFEHQPKFCLSMPPICRCQELRGGQSDEGRQNAPMLIIFMGKRLNRTNKIPAFIKKLKQILDDKNSTDIICWLPEGNGFQILNTSAFTDQVLPENFKHRNMASFVRQLNMYGFNRPKESGQNVYIHPRFQKGNLSSIKLIKRKIGSAKAHDDSNSPEHWKSSPEQNPDVLMLEYQKLAADNDMLRKQNYELIIRLGKFEEMMGKIKVYTQEIDHLLLMRRDQVETEKTEKQATSSSCSSEGSLNSLNSGSQLNRKGFSLCNSGPFQSSYQILLQGKPDQN